MPIVMMDGFDLYNSNTTGIGVQSKWIIAVGTVVGVTTPAGRFGGQCCAVAQGRALTRAFASGAIFTIGFAFRAPSLVGFISPALSIMGFTNGTLTAGVQCMLAVDNLGRIQVQRGVNYQAAGTVLGTSSAGVIVANTWHYIEWEFELHDTTGIARVYVDGVSVISLTAQDTKALASAVVDGLYFTAQNAANDLDDLYLITGATRLGERRIDTLRPSADTATKMFTRSVGTDNFALVDETVVDTADYVSGTVLNDLDLYEFGNLATTPTTINAVQLMSFAHKTDAGSRNIALVADVSAVQAQTADFALPATVNKQEGIMETKPGGGAWTAADVNAMKAGPKVTL